MRVIFCSPFLTVQCLTRDMGFNLITIDAH